MGRVFDDEEYEEEKETKQNETQAAFKGIVSTVLDQYIHHRPKHKRVENQQLVR